MSWVQTNESEIHQPGGSYRVNLETGRQEKWVEDTGQTHPSWEGPAGQPDAIPLNPYYAEVFELRRQVWANGWRPIPATDLNHHDKKAGKAIRKWDWCEKARQNPPVAAVDPMEYQHTNTAVLW